MQNHFKYLTLMAAVLLLTVNACKKYKDPPPTDGDDRLTNPYCNDPNAVNYNWGFPGIPDNSICIYPVDSFVGQWMFLDSVYLENNDFSHFAEKMLTFSSLEDSTFKHIAIEGWCNSDTIFAIADKYYNAIVDTLLEGYDGQLICANDSISGFFNLNTYKKDTMQIELRIQNNTRSELHKGWAIKQ